MTYLISQYWIFIALALLLGLFVGWSTRGGAQEPAPWLYPALGAWGVGLLLAVVKVVPGALGHALEVALLLFAAYIVGCFAGSVFGETRDDGGLKASGAGAADAGIAGASANAGGAAAAHAERSVAAEESARSNAPRVAMVADAAEPHAAQGEAAKDEASKEDLVSETVPARAMTDGRRSLTAQQKKDAERAARPAAASANARADAPKASSAPEAAVEAARPVARLIAPAHAPMTDGARTLAVLKRKEEERALRRAAAAAQAKATSTTATEPASAAATTTDDRPADDTEAGAPADDLKLIRGVGPKNEAILNGLGVRRFGQIADWSDANARWVGAHMSFPGRVEREHWVAQAKFLAAGLDTEHSAAVKSGRIIVDESADTPLSEDQARALAASLPEQAARVHGEESHAGARPLGLANARGDSADNLKLIKGIGPQNEARLHALGVWHFDQIAAWTPENVKWIGSYLAFSGRIDRENWIEQARALSGGKPAARDPASRLI
ncbi:MAG: cell envelope biogenesis protein TolA [Beijerinckiaceae bacterium]